MRGGRQARAHGNAAEAYVANLLQSEFNETKVGAAVLPLQQDAPADLVALIDGAGWLLYEVKSSKLRRVALKLPLTPSERDAQALFGSRYVVIRVLRIPGKPDRFEVLSRGT